MIGKTFGNYKFIKEIGEGGMGIVYLVEHSVLGKKYAAKVLDYKLARKADLKERFLREAKSQAALQHKSIVSVVDYIEEGDIHFLVSEYIDGLNLAQYMSKKKKKMGFKEILKIMEGPIGALNYVHSTGIIHRDVKPSNILIDFEGQGHITDFGIAMILGLDQITKTAGGMGTPHYMSPEQAINPRKIDHRSDIYSLGCILFEMAAGEPPFDGDTSFQILQKQKDEKPPLEKMNSKLPQYFNSAVDKALTKNPEDRFSGCGEMLIALKGTATKSHKIITINNDIISPDIPTDIPSANKNEETNAKVNNRTYTIWAIAGIFLLAFSILLILFLKQSEKQKDLAEKARLENEKALIQIGKQDESIREQSRTIKKLAEATEAQSRKIEDERLKQQIEIENRKKLELEEKQKEADKAKIEQAEIETEKLKQQAEKLLNQNTSATGISAKTYVKDNTYTHSENSDGINQISNDSSSLKTNVKSEESNRYLIQESDLDKPLTLVKKVLPNYPTYYFKKYKKTGIKKSGIVRVAVIIFTDGSVGGVNIVGGDNDKYFNEEALKALRQRKYKSPLYKNQMVKTQTTVEIKFE